MKRMMFLLLALLFLMGCGADSSSCSSNAMKKELSRICGVDLTHAVVLEGMDTHGGFQGEGTSYCKLRFSEAPQLGEGWKELPTSETVTALAYGIQTEHSIIGPYIPEGLIPEVENGCYFFLDQHSESEDPWDDSLVLERYSRNFTLAIYDEDTNILYYVEEDT